jgi:hypothetical protein
LLLLATVPLVCERVLERLDGFRKLAVLDDTSLDESIRVKGRSKKARH